MIRYATFQHGWAHSEDAEYETLMSPRCEAVSLDVEEQKVVTKAIQAGSEQTTSQGT